METASDFPHLTELIRKLESRQAVVAIVGMGYVGLPLAIRFSQVGYKVLGVDIDEEKVHRLNSGHTYIKHVPVESIANARASGFRATSRFEVCRDADALIICVPTPLNRHREPDLSFVLGTIESLIPHLRNGQVISLESTTYPGTTEEQLKPRIEAAGFSVGSDIFLVFSPEREDPANPHYTTKNTPKVCGADTPNCRRAGLALYAQIVERLVPVSSTRAAEMTKLLENIHRAVNIGLVNEMKIIADRMQIDIHEVIRAAATKPFGFVPYYPGPGLGGHCIPIDPFYLTWKAREYGLHTRFIELAGEVNSNMPEWVLEKIADALNARGKPIRNARVLILGIAYKKNVDDMRESPAVRIMELLVSKGAVVEYSDPHVPIFPRMREHSFNLKSVPLNPECLAGYDCVVLVTNHDDFDYELIGAHAKLIVDTRGVYLDPVEKVVRA